MNIGDEFEVKIEKLSNLGYGIAKIDGQVVFVENACPEDVLKIRVTKINKNYLTADIADFVTPSKYRCEPFCPMQKICGSCQIQYIDYNYQLKLKQEIVKDNIVKIGQIDTPINFPVPSPKIKNFRQKIQYPVQRTKNSKRILAGYYKPKSHDLINIKYCPIQPELCDKIIEYIRENFPLKWAKYLKHIVIRGSEYSNKFLVTLVVAQKFDTLKDFAESLMSEYPQIAGVCANINNKHTNVILSDKTECLAGVDYVEEKLLDKVFKIGANTFFQVNPKSAENIFKYIKEEISKSEKPAVLDAYAGIAAIGITISDAAGKVTSVEENKESIKLAQETLINNNIDNVELFAQDTLKYLKSIKKKFDITILDPPRKGCTEEVLKETLNHTKNKIIYVSCNPSALARDLKYLHENGCKIVSLQPFDMFCHTYHIETVAVIEI